MIAFVVSFSIALLFTAVFAFRFRTWRQPRTLAVYFVGILAVEWIADHFFLPVGALGLEVAYVCFALSAIFFGAIYVAHRFDLGSGGDE